MISPGGIRLESVARHFMTPAGVVRALDEITIDVAPGSSVAVVGPSGCGKSTLLGLIGGLAVPTSGRVIVDGHEMSDLPSDGRARLRRTAIGFVFQADNLVPWLTAVENIAVQLALSNAGERAERCVELLHDVGLADHRDKLPDQLSRGQRQRVAVARALVHRPRLVLADEPTGSLDADSSTALIDVVLAAQRDAGATLLVVTHDASVADRMDRTLGLRDGRVEHDLTNDDGRRNSNRGP
jgi:putative ABC transport system ATP-binding protein